MSDQALDFTLANVGAGPDPLRLSALAETHDFVVLLFQRDQHCTNCRKQVKQIRDRYGDFADRNVEVVSIVPEPREAVEEWQKRYDPPFPLCAGPEASVGETYDQPVRFGFLGKWSDFLGRMPVVALVDVRETPEVVWSYRGSSTFDRPDIDEILSKIDEYAG